MKRKFVIICLVMLIVAIVISVVIVFNTNEKNKNTHEVNEPIDITWWHTLDSQYDEYIEKIISEFNNTHKNITVHAEYVGSWNDINEKLVMANAAGNNLPAVAVCNTKFIASYADNGLFEDLNKYIKDTKYDVSDFAEGMYSIGTYNGKQVALPFLHNTQVVYYNKTALENNNLTLPTEFSNVDSFLNEVKKKTGMTPLSMQSLDFYYGTIYRNSGVKIISDDGSDLNSEKSLEITSQIKNWCENGLVSWLQGNSASNDMKQSFYNQESFAVLHNSSALPTYMKKCNFEVGMAWYPAVNGVAHGDMGGGVIGIPAKNDQKTKDAAWIFIQYLCDKDVNTELSIKTGNIPIRKSAVESPVISEYIKKYPEYKKLYDNLQNIYPPIINSHASEIVKVWQNYMNKVMLQYENPKEMMNAAVKEINEILENSK